MTAQSSEILINDSDVDLGHLKPYFVRRADKTEAYPVVPESSVRCSMNWNGYVATMRLHSDYRLELVHFDFPFADESHSQICNAYFDGDFALTFRPFFFGPSTTIPFRSGRIVPERDAWQIDDQTLDGVVLSIARNPDTNKPIGLLLDVGSTGLAPLSLIPVPHRNNLDAMVGQRVSSSIRDIDYERGYVVVEIKRIETSNQLHAA